MSSEAVFKDAFNLMCGGLIGEGVHRKVFDCRLRPDLVVKVEEDDGFRYFANVHEMKLWCEAGPRERRWLAPCIFMSPEGRILLQRRVDPLPQDYELPAEMPSFLTDFKRDNFGLLGGALVCIDYAATITAVSNKMKRVTWDWAAEKSC